MGVVSYTCIWEYIDGCGYMLTLTFPIIDPRGLLSQSSLINNSQGSPVSPSSVSLDRLSERKREGREREKGERERERKREGRKREREGRERERREREREKGERERRERETHTQGCNAYGERGMERTERKRSLPEPPSMEHLLPIHVFPHFNYSSNV